MEKPQVADTKPIAVRLKSGEENHWCACGRSDNQPFCGGSLRGTAFTPVAFRAEEDEEAWLCMCKDTGNPPYCDGTHARLGNDGDAAPRYRRAYGRRRKNPR